MCIRDSNWNGAIGEEQLQWFDNQLRQAENQNRKVAVFCHFPLLPYESHTLWNQAEIISVIENYNCVKLWLNGHNQDVYKRQVLAEFPIDWESIFLKMSNMWDMKLLIM